MRMARKRNLSQKPILYKSVLSFCLAILLTLQTVTFTASANQVEEPEITAPESSVTEAVYGDPEGAVIMPLVGEPLDKTGVLVAANPKFMLTVKQGSPEVVIPVDGEINGRENFVLALNNIAVPTQGDNPSAPSATVIQQGDFAVLDKATYFPDVNLIPAGPMRIKQGNLDIATVQFFADFIKITFDGAGVYDGSKNSVKIGFSANAKAADQSPGGGGNTTIFGDGFKFTNSALVPVYRISTANQSPSGHYIWISAPAFQEGAVAWRVIVASNDKDDPTIQMKLDKLTVVDTLTDAGPYKAGSFKLYKAKTTVDANGNIKEVTAPVEVSGAGEPVIDPINGTLTYTFPDGFGDSAAYLDFKTWIPKGKWYNEFDGTNGGAVGPNDSRHMEVKTSAKLLAEDGTTPLAPLVGSLDVSAALTPDWIQQTGAVGSKDSNGNRLIIWTITVNERNYHRGNTPVAGLKEVTITDVLPAGTEFVSATYTVNGVDKGAITPVNDVFSIGDTDGPIRLTIVSRVTNSNISTFTNVPRANWKLANPQGIDWNNDATGIAPNGVTATTKVTIGAHAFTKGVETHTNPAYALYNVAGAKWGISLTLQYDLDDPIVYDLLVHGGSLDVLNNLDDNPQMTPATLAAIKSRIDNKQLWQKYREGSLTVSNGLAGEVIPLMVDGVQVADLIKVTGYKGGAKGDVSFESVTTNPDNLFRQDNGGDWSNRGLFFDGDSYEGHYDATVKNRVRMLNKEMLFASTVDENGNELGNIAADWNRNYGNWSGSTWTRQIVVNDPNLYIDNSREDKYILAGYDRKDRTVTFRLAVNMPGFKTDEMAKDGGARVASDIKLVDTLPEGWEFVDYRLYAGVTGYNTNSGLGLQSGGGYGQYVQAAAIIQQTDPKHVVHFTSNGNVGTFTFSKLESPYVILVKAKPTDDKMASYQIGSNNAGENQAEFSMKWGDKPYSATEKHRIIVRVQSLSKSVKKPVSGVQEWTVNYTPPFKVEQSVYLLDTLSKGLKLRKDATGNLSLAPSDIAVYAGEMKADGTLQRIGQPLNLANPNSEVKVTAGTDPVTEGSTLRFDFTDPNKLYQIVYQTESQGMQPGTAGNSIKLMGDDTLPPIGAQSSIMLDANDVAGSASENGLLFLKKVGPDGTTPLKDVKFKLYNPDGTPAKDMNNIEMEEKKTGPDGKTNFIIQVPGDYLLKQTYIDPVTYLPTTTIYRVRVIDAPGKPVLVDGQKVDLNNPLVVPTPITGKLTISNKVVGNGADVNKVFKYTITFAGEGAEASYPYTDLDGSSKTIKSGDKIELKDGQSLVIPMLLKDLIYTVTETDYSAEEYTTEPANRIYTDTIIGNGDHKADFVNKRTVYGGLLIDNTVTGSGGDKTKDFDYAVTITGGAAGEEYAYTKTTQAGVTETGKLKSDDAVSLKDGEKLAIDLPAGLAYAVKQTDYTGEDYITTPSGLEVAGTIEHSKTAEAKFTNHKDLPGNLLISNTVIGNGSNPDMEFEYTVNFAGAGAGRTYIYQYNDGTSGSIENSGKLLLKHGQKVTIRDILKDTSYTVTQKGYAADQYTTDPASLERTGVIQENETAQAPFENARYLPGTLALEPKEQKVPGDGKTPAELTATLTGTDGEPVEGKVVVFTVAGVEIGRATTGKDGKATIQYTPPKLTDITPEEYGVTATTTATSTSGVPYNEDTAKVITMPAALTGVLRDNTTGKIISDADIIVKNVKTGEEFFIKTDSEGKYYHPVQRDEEYTITYSKMIPIGGVLTPVPFTQKGIIEDNDPTTEGNLIPAEITAVGIVLFQQPDGKSALLNSASTPHMKIYLKDAQGNYIEENGKPKAFPMAANGTFAVEGLTTGTYTMEVRYEVAPGKELRLIKDAKLNVLANGELNISQELVDPYGIVYDANKGIATGQIEGATVTLYYADTDRNRNKGITPGTKVTTLPTIPDFVPNFNKNPEQDSDVTGSYAYMVFPETDYYLIVTKSGYQTYISPTISVEWDIVKHNVPMQPNSSSGNSGGNTGGNTGNNPGTDNGNPPGGDNNGTDNGNPPGGDNNGTDNGNPPGGDNNGTDNGNPPGGNNGTDNGNPPDGNNGSGKGIDARPPEDDELDNVPKTGDSGASSTFYLALTLIALIGLLIAIPFRKKKIN